MDERISDAIRWSSARSLERGVLVEPFVQKLRLAEIRVCSPASSSRSLPHRRRRAAAYDSSSHPSARLPDAPTGSSLGDRTMRRVLATGLNPLNREMFSPDNSQREKT
jgi:hypothetical protein